MEFEPRLKHKNWDIENEKIIAESWRNEGVFKFDPMSKKTLFVIDTPPPYPSGTPWHIGAAAHYSQIDMIARTARMVGNQVLFPIGIDRNGIAVEIYAEKKFNIKMQETPRERFLLFCQKALDELEAEMLKIMKAMGLSGDFQNYYRTDSPEFRALTQSTFIDLWKKGLIYEETRPNNYCPSCKTTIADAEIDYEEVPTQLVSIKFPVKETKNEFVTIATTRPELMCACQAIIFHPDDSRYKKYEGLTVILPGYDREVPILKNSSAKPDFGTGMLMVCSYGDQTDVSLFRELNLKEIIAVDKNNRMTKEAGKFEGMTVKEARTKVIEELERLGFVENKSVIKHRTPKCSRSGDEVQIIPMKEYYLNQIKFLPQVKKMAEELIFFPPQHKQLLMDWVLSVKYDWPISRRRFCATEIPIWYCKACTKPFVPIPGRYYRPWVETPPINKCPFCGKSKGFLGESRTFDTWMDSSITPLYNSKFNKDTQFFRKVYPISIRPQGKDIVRTWLYYSLLRCFLATGKKPFYRVWISGMAVDEKGEKMSKSRGNVIDPMPLLKKYGADAFRLWNALEVSHGYDFRASAQRIEAASRVLTKIWNLARYVSTFTAPEKAELTDTDKWMLSELNKLTKECLKGYQKLDFFEVSSKIREFLWNVFASNYLEMVKARAYGKASGQGDKKIIFIQEERRSAWYTLHTCFKHLLILLAPIIPFMTDHIWRKMYGLRSIHLEKFPTETKFIQKKYTELTKKLLDFNSSVWAEKKKQLISLKDPISVLIPEELKIFVKDLTAMHNIE